MRKILFLLFIFILGGYYFSYPYGWQLFHSRAIKVSNLNVLIPKGSYVWELNGDDLVLHSVPAGPIISISYVPKSFDSRILLSALCKVGNRCDVAEENVKIGGKVVRYYDVTLDGTFKMDVYHDDASGLHIGHIGDASSVRSQRAFVLKIIDGVD